VTGLRRDPALTEVVDGRPQAVGRNVERRKRDRKPETPPARASWIQVEHACEQASNIAPCTAWQINSLARRSASGPRAPGPMIATIAASQVGSGYENFTKEYERILARYGVVLEIRNSAGALKNLDLLRNPASGCRQRSLRAEPRKR
jgi:hypothetical protein